MRPITLTFDDRPHKRDKRPLGIRLRKLLKYAAYCGLKIRPHPVGLRIADPAEHYRLYGDDGAA